jgi:lactate racemase
MELKYGKEKLQFQPEGLGQVKVLLPAEKKGVRDPLQAVRESLKSPTGTPALKDMLREMKPESLVIVVNDITRPTPYKYMLPPLLEEIEGAGIASEQITFIIATGIHGSHTREQDEEVFGKELIDKYRFISHDPDRDLVDLGYLPSGHRLLMNRYVAEADFLITTGLITPHYFATYSGGRKSILPGVSGRESIQENHSMMVDYFDQEIELAKNPINLDMIDAARRVELNFILNVVTNSQKEIVKVVAGEAVEAWQEGVEVSAEMYRVPLEKKADITVVSAGGFPKDINMYQAQKALDNARKATREGGIILLIAECSMGLGEDTFARWMNEAEKPQDVIERIKKGFVLGGHKAYAIARVVENKEVILVSDLNKEMTENLFFRKADSLEDGLEYIENNIGRFSSGEPFTVIMPEGSLTVPEFK